jgi:meso-butanediol dehydrogenase/(S,S)-butanediol dehydrogenase/diacetyl reductase
MSFDQKVCVVTGGSSGIGLATVNRFANRKARVIALSRTDDSNDRLQQLAEDRGWTLTTVTGDVADPQAWKDVLEAAASYGPIDVLVNSAGYGKQGTVLELTQQDWEDQFRTNVTGVFLGCQAVLPQMLEKRSGSIVNVGSVAGEIGMARRAAYCASKAAIVGLTRAMAVDHARDGVRINVVAPGTTETPYFQSIGADVEDPEEYLNYLNNRQIIGRMGTPDEIAAAIEFLASDEASFAVGSVLTVDGGMSVW